MSSMRSVALVMCVLSGAAVLSAQTTKAQAPAKPAPAAKKNALPPAVEAAFKKAYPSATIKEFSAEKEDGRMEYEIESVDGKTNRDLVYLADGTLVMAEEAIDVAAVPAPVLAALKAKYPKATVTKYEKLTKGTTVSYEMQLKGVAAKEAEFAPDGTLIVPKPEKK